MTPPEAAPMREDVMQADCKWRSGFNMPVVEQRHRDAAAWAMDQAPDSATWERLTEAHVTPNRLWQMNRVAEAMARMEQQVLAHTARPDVHSDDTAVDLFAARMKEKLAAARAKGRHGWDDPTVCCADYLRALLNEHVGKGDPVDVANFCMMLSHREESTAHPDAGDEVERVRPLRNRVTSGDLAGDRLWLVSAEWRAGHDRRRVRLENVYDTEAAAQTKWECLTPEAHNAAYGFPQDFDAGFVRHPIRVFAAMREGVDRGMVERERLALEDAAALERTADEEDENGWLDWAATTRQAAKRFRSALSRKEPIR